MRSTIFAIAGTTDIGRNFDGSLRSLVFDSAVISACFHADGTLPVTRLLFTMSNGTWPTPSKPFWKSFTLISSSPEEEDDAILRTTYHKSTCVTGWIWKKPVATLGSLTGKPAGTCGTVTAVVGQHRQNSHWEHLGARSVQWVHLFASNNRFDTSPHIPIPPFRYLHPDMVPTVTPIAARGCLFRAL